jgi:hypothetical protein
MSFIKYIPAYVSIGALCSHHGFRKFVLVQPKPGIPELVTREIRGIFSFWCHSRYKTDWHCLHVNEE